MLLDLKLTRYPTKPWWLEFALTQNDNEVLVLVVKVVHDYMVQHSLPLEFKQLGQIGS